MNLKKNSHQAQGEIRAGFLLTIHKIQFCFVFLLNQTAILYFVFFQNLFTNTIFVLTYILNNDIQNNIFSKLSLHVGGVPSHNTKVTQYVFQQMHKKTKSKNNNIFNDLFFFCLQNFKYIKAKIYSTHTAHVYRTKKSFGENCFVNNKH